MTYTPLQIEIIKRFGKQKLTEGCIIKYGDGVIQKYPSPYVPIDGNREYEILGHIPHFERILEVLFDNDIGVTLWNMHKKSIILEFLNEEDELCRTREIDCDWTKEPLEQPESILQELLSLFPNE